MDRTKPAHTFEHTCMPVRRPGGQIYLITSPSRVSFLL